MLRVGSVKTREISKLRMHDVYFCLPAFSPRPTHLTNYRVNKTGKVNPTPIDRVNKSISNNIRLTYKCHTLLTTYWVNILGYFEIHKKMI